MKVPKATHILGNEPRLFMCSLKWVPKGLYLRWLEEPSGTPQVLGSTPRGSEFQAEVKKIPSLAPVPMHWCGRPRSAWGPLHGPVGVSMGYGPQCQGGARVRGFSRSGKPRLLLESQYRWGGLSPPGRVFFYNKIYAASFMIHHLRPRLPSNNYIVMPYSPRKTILLCSYAGLNLKLTIL